MELPDMPEARHHHTGHRWVDYIIAGSALLVSCISLFLAIQHGHTMEKLVAANSWPNLADSSEIKPGDGGVAYSLSIENTGVGPAFLQTMEVWQDGKPVASMRELLKRIVGAAGYAGKPLSIRGGNFIGSFISSRDHVTLLDVTFPGLAASRSAVFLPVVSHQRIRLCYCSVFDECYVADGGPRRLKPRRVDACPVPGHPFDDDLSRVLRVDPPAAGAALAAPGDKAVATP